VFPAGVVRRSGRCAAAPWQRYCRICMAGRLRRVGR